MQPIVAIILAASVAKSRTGSKRRALFLRILWSRILQARDAVAAALPPLHMILPHVKLLPIILLSAVSPLAAQTPADIARVSRDIPKSLNLQTELPVLKLEDGGAWGLWNLNVPEAFLWIAVIAGAGVLAYYIIEILPAGMAGRQRWDDSLGGANGGQLSADAAARAAADELAAQGRFVEAMHVLLLQGLDDMRMRLDLSFADSLTSREIVSRANAPAGAKAALRDIIQWVERAYFGDHPVDRGDYDACRRSFLALDTILSAGGRE